MRKVAVAGLVLVALLAGVFAWRGSAAARARAAHPGEAEPAAPEAPTHPGAGGARTRDDGMIPIEGRVTDGHDDLSPSDGLLRFRVDDGPASEAPIHEGGFEACAPKGATLAVEEILFGERKAVATPATVTVPEDGRVEIVGRWVVPTLLHVIDEKGENIGRVELYETADDDEWGPGWPQGISASSPVELAGAEGIHTYVVRAPGYAWSRITLFVGLGGERVVRLVRAGALDVRLTPYDPEAGITVRVDTSCYWEPDETGRVHVDSLRPGDREVVAQVGGSRAVVAQGVARIEAGATTALTLAVGELPREPDLVPLAGTFRADPGWPAGEEDDEPQGFCVWTTGAELTVLASGDRYEHDATFDKEEGIWSARPVPPGWCFLSFRDWAYGLAVEVGPQGNTAVDVVIPPPTDVEVRIVNAESGELVPEEQGLEWAVTASNVGHEFKGAWVYGLKRAPSDEPGVFRFRAPLGTLLLDFWSDSYGALGVEFPLKPGSNHITLKVAPILRAEVILRDGIMPVPADADFGEGIRVLTLTGEGTLEEFGTGAPFDLWFTKPGRYRVTFPDIEGYEPIAPVELEVVAGKIAKVEVALLRRVK